MPAHRLRRRFRSCSCGGARRRAEVVTIFGYTGTGLVPADFDDGGARVPFALPGMPRGDETILVVEDEEIVRRLVVSVLELSGYNVLAGGGAEEAVAVSATHDGPIHLLLTDIDMPGTSGRQLAQRLRADRPESRILYMSGRENVEIINHGVLPTGTLFLPKPFTPYGLTWKVREVLDGTGA